MMQVYQCTDCKKYFECWDDNVLPDEFPECFEDDEE